MIYIYYGEYNDAPGLLYKGGWLGGNTKDEAGFWEWFKKEEHSTWAVFNTNLANWSQGHSVRRGVEAHPINIYIVELPGESDRKAYDEAPDRLPLKSAVDNGFYYQLPRPEGEVDDAPVAPKTYSELLENVSGIIAQLSS